MLKITNTIGGSIGEEIYSLWKEYENKSSEEAKLVKEFDRFEMIVQALEYESAQELNLESFFQSTKGTFKNPLVIKWVEELQKKRLKQ